MGSALQGIRELAQHQGGETKKRDNADDVSYCRQYHVERYVDTDGDLVDIRQAASGIAVFATLIVLRIFDISMLSSASNATAKS